MIGQEERSGCETVRPKIISRTGRNINAGKITIDYYLIKGVVIDKQVDNRAE